MRRLYWLLSILALAPAVQAQSPAGGPVMGVFFYWYRFVPDATGGPDITRSEHFYFGDPVNGLWGTAFADAFPETVDGDPLRPYRSIVDWGNPAWYRVEFDDMASARVDIALMCAFNYLPLRAYRDSGTFFSYAGPPIAAQTVRAMQSEGRPAPKLAMFWDTGILTNYDLTTGFTSADYHEDPYPSLNYTKNAWAAWLAVREFFRSLGADNAQRSQVWGTVDGRPVIDVYARERSTLCTQRFFTWLSDQFLLEFGVRPYIILDHSWTTGTDGNPVHGDAVTQWGAAFDGPTDLVPAYGGDRIVSVGPGYDATIQPVRWGDPIRLREDGLRGDLNPTGTFYDYSWQTALAMKPKAVLLETWNERHEGSSIARTPEWGTNYIEKTAHYAALYHAGVNVPLVTKPASRRMRQFVKDGPEFAGRSVLRYTAPADTQGTGKPLMFRQTSTSGPNEGGLWVLRSNNSGEVRWMNPFLYAQASATWSYLHVQVADTWGFDIPDNRTVNVRLTYVDDRSLETTDPPGESADIFIQYDSWDPALNVGEDPSSTWPEGNLYRDTYHGYSGIMNTVTDGDGVIMSTPWGVIPLTGHASSPTVKTITWILKRPRFGNRQDTGADFRIAIRVPSRTVATPLRIISVELLSPPSDESSYLQMGSSSDRLSGSHRATAGIEGFIPEPGGGTTDLLARLDTVALGRRAVGLDAQSGFAGAIPLSQVLATAAWRAAESMAPWQSIRVRSGYPTSYTE